MADSLKQRHLQRGTAPCCGFPFGGCTQHPRARAIDGQRSYVDDFGVVCRQILSNFYTTVLLPQSGR